MYKRQGEDVVLPVLPNGTEPKAGFPRMESELEASPLVILPDPKADCPNVLLDVEDDGFTVDMLCPNGLLVLFVDEKGFGLAN